MNITGRQPNINEEAQALSDSMSKRHEPYVMPMAEAERLGFIHPVRKGNLDPAPSPQQLEMQRGITIRKQLDAEEWQAALAALKPQTRKALDTAIKDLDEAERLLTETKEAQAAHEAEQPSNRAQIESWADRRGRLEGLIIQYRRMAEGARRSYEEAARVAFGEAQEYTRKRYKAAEQQLEADKQEYHRRSAAARAYWSEANARRDGAARIYTLFRNGDLDVFRQKQA